MARDGPEVSLMQQQLDVFVMIFKNRKEEPGGGKQRLRHNAVQFEYPITRLSSVQRGSLFI